MAKRKRYSYLLLELLIAFALVAVSVELLVREPLLMTQGELSLLEKMELERLSENSFATIKSKFYQNEIPWEKIPAAKKSYVEEMPDKVKLTFGKMRERTYTESYTLQTLKEKKDEKNREHKRVRVTIAFTPVSKKKKESDQTIKFTHELYIMKEGT